MKKILFWLLFGLFSLYATGLSYAQMNEKNIKLTGNLFSDSKILLTKYDEDKIISKFEISQRKSPIKSALFSLAIPGAGQFSNGDYWLSAVFIVAEAAFITTAVIYNNKGNNQTNFFQNYADQHWSVKTYAQWTLNNLSNLDPNLQASDFHVFDNNGNVVWSELNRLETAIGNDVGGYSHNLPPHGEQQYYELIGKYPQYSHGWDDANQSDTDFHILSPEFLYYSDQRGEANDLYRVSARAVALIYINHIISALEAAWGAARFNKNLSVNMRINAINLAYRVEYVPTLNIKLSF
jgi:Family of unknown function (DUF5683)